MEKIISSLEDELSLKETVLRKIATTLCNNPSFARFSVCTYLMPYTKTKKELAVQNKVSQLVSGFGLPPLIVKELLNIMKPICREMAKWVNFHEKFFNNSYPWLRFLPFFRCLCWTPKGTVDYQKTARELIRQEILDVEKLYKLACLYCLDDCIRDIFKKIPLKTRVRHYTRRGSLHTKQPDIVIHWTYVIKGHEHRLDRILRLADRGYLSVYQYAFEMAARNGYKTAAEYFFQELDAEERQESLMMTARVVADQRAFDDGSYEYEYQKFSDVLFHLLSLMCEEEQMDLLQGYPLEVLKCCLDWPRQDIFVDLAKIAFPYLDVEGYSRLVYILAKNITSGYNYSEVFRQLFLVSPKIMKDHLRIRYGNFLQEFFKDIETVKFIFRNTAAAKRTSLALSYSGCYSFMDIVEENNWELMETILQEAIPTYEDKLNFEEAFLKRYGSKLHLEGFNKLYNFLAAFIANATDKLCSKRDDSAEEDFPSVENVEMQRDEKLTENPPTGHFETRSDKELIGSATAECLETCPDQNLMKLPSVENFETHANEERSENPCKKLKTTE